MNFSLTEEHKMIRDAARDFAQTELLPGVIERDEHQTFPAEQIKLRSGPPESQQISFEDKPFSSCFKIRLGPQ